ncbi:MAG TPA: pirin family protein [Xanthomonadaceae bacterium]|jgi:redox-sensitive bicupin YhaK (pirin superfamily)|nr:pirin family protein [Xanthomonadaceae bacterium]
MILLRRANERGHAQHGWLDSHHTFSFADYHDPQWMGFGPLRVINEDRVAPGGGFAPHRHANMEILSYVIEGGLQHRDSIGNGSVIVPGDVQMMSAGSGIEHSEFNASKETPVHFLQIWIQPDRINASPRYAQENYPVDVRHGVLKLVASPDGAEGSLPIRQDARVFATVLSAGQLVSHALGEGRRAWVQVVRGRLRLGEDIVLDEGDAAGLADRSGLDLHAASECEALVFDLP